MLQWKKEQYTPFSTKDLELDAKTQKMFLEKEVLAFTAADAITQVNISEGFGGSQIPFLFRVEPVEEGRL